MSDRSHADKPRDAGPKLADLPRQWAWQELRHRLAVNRKDGSVMVHIPEGEFEMGDGKEGNCPKHRVCLSAYWIGVFCVSNAQYLKFVEATGHRAPDQSDHGRAREIWKGRSFPKEKASHPVVCVSWNDAVAYGKWADCELATEAQWEKAARGPRGLIYPWGNDWDARRCRNDRNKGSATTGPVFSYPGGTSGYGTYNQAGNIWEWCTDWYEDSYYGQSPKRDPLGPERGSDRVNRGGSWWPGVPALFRGAARTRAGPSFRAAGRGFRLVRTLSGPLPS